MGRTAGSFRKEEIRIKSGANGMSDIDGNTREGNGAEAGTLKIIYEG
jgi:hypothetical protein